MWRDVDKRFDNPLEKYREEAYFWMVLCILTNAGWVINAILWTFRYFGR